jgi:hypothetical protein
MKKITLGCPCDPAPLPAINTLLRIAEGFSRPRLDLYEYDRISVTCDDIDLPSAESIVTLQHRITD